MNNDDAAPPNTRTLRNVPHDVRFRRLVDLEPGEKVEDLPIMRRPVVDKMGAQASPQKIGHLLVVIERGCVISSLPQDAEVETEDQW